MEGIKGTLERFERNTKDKNAQSRVGKALERAKQRIVDKYTRVERGIADKYNRVKHWRGFGLLALLYIALWFYFLFEMYLPWSEAVLLGSQSWFPFPLSMSVAMFIFLVPALLGLPGAFYVVWTNLLRRLIRRV